MLCFVRQRRLRARLSLARPLFPLRACSLCAQARRCGKGSSREQREQQEQTTHQQEQNDAAIQPSSKEKAASPRGLRDGEGVRAGWRPPTMLAVDIVTVAEHAGSFCAAAASLREYSSLRECLTVRLQPKQLFPSAGPSVHVRFSRCLVNHRTPPVLLAMSKTLLIVCIIAALVCATSQWKQQRTQQASSRGQTDGSQATSDRQRPATMQLHPPPLLSHGTVVVPPSPRPRCGRASSSAERSVAGCREPAAARARPES